MRTGRPIQRSWFWTATLHPSKTAGRWSGHSPESFVIEALAETMVALKRGYSDQLNSYYLQLNINQFDSLFIEGIALCYTPRPAATISIACFACSWNRGTALGSYRLSMGPRSYILACFASTGSPTVSCNTDCIDLPAFVACGVLINSIAGTKQFNVGR